jgi:hypothetical protein
MLAAKLQRLPRNSRPQPQPQPQPLCAHSRGLLTAARAVVTSRARTRRNSSSNSSSASASTSGGGGGGAVERPVSAGAALRQQSDAYLRMSLEDMRAHLEYIGSIGMPLEPQHFLYLAQREARAGNYDEAREVFKTGSRQFLLSPQIWCAWGLMEQRVGRPDRARLYFKAALKARTDHGQSWLAWARLEREQGDEARARTLLFYGSQTCPYHVPLLAARGVEEGRSGGGMAGGAQRMFEAALAIEPGNARLWEMWARSEEDAGNAGRATELAAQGVAACAAAGGAPPPAAAAAIVAVAAGQAGQTGQAGYTAEAAAAAQAAVGAAKVFVGGLDRRFDDASLRLVFQEFGAVRTAVVMRFEDTGKSRGFGFVTFAAADGSAERAVAALHEQPLRLPQGKAADAEAAVRDELREGTAALKAAQEKEEEEEEEEE